MSDEQPPEVAPPVDEVEPRGAREILIDRYMEAVRDELLAAGYLSPTAVREREAAAWDAAHRAFCDCEDFPEADDWKHHVNPFKGGA